MRFRAPLPPIAARLSRRLPLLVAAGLTMAVHGASGQTEEVTAPPIVSTDVAAVPAEIPFIASTPAGEAATDAPTAPVNPALPALAPGDRPIRILLEKAAYWDDKGQHDTALAFYKRVLAAIPDNADALAGSARIAIAAGQTDIANGYLARLRAVAADDPALASLEKLRPRTSEDIATLAEARRLAAAGKKDEALAQYRKIIPADAVPDDLALEYYPLLISASPADSVDASDALTALGALADKSPDNKVLQLIYAQAMISTEGSRADGIEKLRGLAKGTTVATEARTSWRAALLWQGADFQAQEQLETYLRENPSDPELEAKREEYRASLPSEGVRARMRAYEAMRTKQMATAERELLAAIAFDDKDVDAIIMVAAIRQQQHRMAESRKLVDRALMLAPDRRAELLGIVGADPEANARAAATAARAVTAQYEQVAALTKQGNYDQAEQNLRRLMGKSPNVGNYLQLGDIQSRAGRLDDAVASLRKAIEMAPTNTDANLALVAVLTRQGKKDEVAAMETQAAESLARSGNVTALLALRRSRAEQLRTQARDLRDAAKVAPLREALSLDPTNAWLRLELAKALRKSGADADAQQVMAQLETNRPAPGAAQSDVLQVAFFWSEERGDWPAAAAVAERVPLPQRTPQMLEVQDRVALQNEISQATRPGDAAGSRRRLVAIAARPDPAGNRGTEIARALLRVGGADDVKRAVMSALASTPAATQQQRLAYAGVLLEASLNADARATADGIDPSRLTADQRKAFNRLTDDLVADQADTLIQQGKLAEAHDLLTKRLADSPNNAKLNLSLSRWQRASGDSSAALTVSETVAQRNPDDIGARHAAIDAAIAAREYRRADPLIADGLKRFPNDPFLLMQAATIERSRSNYGRALEYMEKARSLRAQQVVSSQ